MCDSCTDYYVCLLYTSSETGEGLYEAIDASRETGMWEAVAPYRQLYMLQIIRFFVEILVELSYEAMQVTDGEKEEIP